MAKEKRLIDAESVRHKINAFAASVVYRGNAEMFNGKDTCNPYEYTRGYERGILDAQKIVCGEETVDAVEVVRCKDCKHMMNNDRNAHLHPCLLHERETWENAFCSNGERRSENG